MSLLLLPGRIRAPQPAEAMEETGDRYAPGRCADCGNDAYIRLESDEMLCAHCYAERNVRQKPAASAPSADERKRARSGLN